jgi:uncharacterized protein YcbK (DUF882 family)
MAGYINKKNGEYNSNDKITENFNYRELACKHCGNIIMSTDLVNKLQKLRNQLNIPITIVSGYRCPNNVPSGSSKKSQHCLGNAIDISLDRKRNMMEIFNMCTNIFSRVGVYYNGNKFGTIHVDISTPPLYWTCDRVNNSGRYVYYNTVPKLIESISKDTKTKWKNILI